MGGVTISNPILPHFQVTVGGEPCTKLTMTDTEITCRTPAEPIRVLEDVDDNFTYPGQ